MGQFGTINSGATTYIITVRLCMISMAASEPTSQDAKPLVQPGVHPTFYITNVGVNPGSNPGFGVLRCGPWFFDDVCLYSG
jgi:hypothetical protein